MDGRTPLTKRVAIDARVSTTDKNQTVENQLRDLLAVAERQGWEVVATFTDEGISGAKGRDKRLAFDALPKGVARKDFDLIACFSVCRIGRNLPDLIHFLSEIQAKGVDLYVHTQGLDNSTLSGAMVFQMPSICFLRKGHNQGENPEWPPADDQEERSQAHA